MIYFFLARDRETGMILDDCFSADRTEIYEDSDGRLRRTNTDPRYRIERVCVGLDLIDYDTCSETMWRWGLRRPKWEKQRPPNVPADKWASRFRSMKELFAYKAGLKAGQQK